MPHQSPSDREVPSKAIDGFSTVPMKVFNGIVHGDHRSHVILSPGVIGATANHTCECLNVMINTAFCEHGVLPSSLSVQFDGATTNKCSLVLAFLGLFVLEGVFSNVRARCQLENHAHDVYDAFHAIHARLVKHSTFYNYEELREITRVAHERVRDPRAHRPVVGHDVKVSDLWEVRDFWEWLAPGYTKTATRENALTNAAFSTFLGLNNLREFKMELEASSTATDSKVGLWAKPYMTSNEYSYLGTLISTTSFRAVTLGKEPPMQQRDVSDQKNTREAKVLEKLVAATKGKYKEQFSAARLADAIAMCKREWKHFSNSSGKLTALEMRLPHELAEAVRSSRSSRSSGSSSSAASSSARSAADALLDPAVNTMPRLRQRRHPGRQFYDWSHNPQIPLVQGSTRSLTDEQFQARPVTPGCFVITRPSAKKRWASHGDKLEELDYWLWQIAAVIPPGDPVPGFDKVAESYTYEAHLFQPVGNSTRGRWIQVFDDLRPQYLRTVEEKKRKHYRIWTRAATPAGGAPAAHKHFLEPVRSYLRPANIVGGGFQRTPGGSIPGFVDMYWARQSALAQMAEA